MPIVPPPLAAQISVLDVLDRVVDKGVVIDAWVNLSVIGIELISVEARVIVASFDTYLRHSSALAHAPFVSRARTASLPPAMI